MLETTTRSISEPLAVYWDRFISFMPQLIGALVVVIVGLIVASVIAAIVRKLLKLAEDNRQVQGFLKRWDIQLRLSGFMGKFVWWVVFLVFISAAVQILQVTVLTNTINSIVHYLPTLFGAAVIAVVALIGARVVKGLTISALEGVNFGHSRLVGNATYVVLLVFGLTIVAAQLGIDMTLVTANLTVIVAGIMLAFGLAFGLGGKEMARDLLAKMRHQAPAAPAQTPVKKRR